MLEKLRVDNAASWRQLAAILTAFVIPAAGFLAGPLAQQWGRLSPDVSRLLMHVGALLAILGLTHVFGWNLADLGLRRKGLRRGLLAAGLLFVFYAVPQWVAALPLRWQPLGWLTVGWAGYYLLVGATEELWMRGLLYATLERRWSPWTAIAGTSVAFGLIHVPGQGMDGFLGAGLSGVAYGLVRARSGNVVGLILAHWLLDLMDKLYVPFAGTPDIALVMASLAVLPVLWVLLWWLPIFARNGGDHAQS